jgi:hypothetical protein
MTDQAQIKARMQATWASGDSAVVATMFTIVGEMFRTVSKHVPPPPGLTPSTTWVAEEHLRAFGERNNISGDATMVLPQDYLEVVVRS